MSNSTRRQVAIRLAELTAISDFHIKGDYEQNILP
jgi:hypothetical protein